MTTNLTEMQMPPSALSIQPDRRVQNWVGIFLTDKHACAYRIVQNNLSFGEDEKSSVWVRERERERGRQGKKAPPCWCVISSIGCPTSCLEVMLMPVGALLPCFFSFSPSLVNRYVVTHASRHRLSLDVDTRVREVFNSASPLHECIFCASCFPSLLMLVHVIRAFW